MTTTLSDYRQAGGRLTAFKTLTQIQGMPANDVLATVDSVAVNEEMADSRFAPPDASGGGVTYLKTPGTAKIPFRYSGRHVWITAAVNGGEAADFIFDTGASITVIDSAYAAKIGLQP